MNNKNGKQYQFLHNYVASVYTNVYDIISFSYLIPFSWSSFLKVLFAKSILKSLLQLLSSIWFTVLDFSSPWALIPKSALHSSLQCHVLLFFFPIFLEPLLQSSFFREQPSSNFINSSSLLSAVFTFSRLDYKTAVYLRDINPLFRLISIGTHAVSPFVKCMRAHIIMLKTCLDCRKYEVNKFLPRRRTAND